MEQRVDKVGAASAGFGLLNILAITLYLLSAKTGGFMQSAPNAFLPNILAQCLMPFIVIRGKRRNSSGISHDNS